MSHQPHEVRADLEQSELRRVEAESWSELRGDRDRRVAGVGTHVEGHALAIERRGVRRTVRANGQQRQMKGQRVAKLRHHRVDRVVSLQGGDGRSQQLRELPVDWSIPLLRGGAEPRQRVDERRSVAPASGAG